MKGTLFTFILTSLLSVIVSAQQLDSLAYFDSSATAGLPTSDSSVSPYTAKLNVANYAFLMANNFKRQAFFPFYFNKKDWLKFGGYALVSGAVALANKPVKEFSVRLHDNNKAVEAVSGFVTKFGYTYGMYTLAGLVTYSVFSKNAKFKTATMLATQSFIISNVLGGGVKTLTSVQGPFYTDPLTNKSGPIFHGPFYTLKKAPNGEKLKSTNYVSFPSGHTFSAFSIATVYAMEYKHKPLVPLFCYSFATLVGLSRLTENRHWAMDIIPGALLGYYSGKQVVNNFHRSFKKGKLAKRTNTKLSVNVGYANSQIIPSLLYQF